jgi:NAD(P)-dependent dehydrogenase (short-subunit alcohol dehydrogenase family)
MDFTGKVIALTGGASGIGLATAKLLVARGASVSIADVNDKNLVSAKATLESLIKEGSKQRILTTTVDVRSTPGVNAWIASTVSALGPLSGAANIAGFHPRWGGTVPVAEMEDSEWEKIMEINCSGVMRCLRAQLGKAAGMGEGGSIVNVGSVAGLQGFKGNMAYVVSTILEAGEGWVQW